MLFEGKDRRELQQAMKTAGRLPPGQSLTLKWPVLHYGSVPRFDPKTWDFRVYGLVESPLKLSWEEFNVLPKVQRTSDFHCVTRWSRFDNRWDGVAFQELLRRGKPKSEAAYVLIHADHGYPLRLIVPHLYAWKSVKWVRGLEFLDHDQAGFWEQNGYHMYGDPWKEQRFSR